MKKTIQLVALLALMMLPMGVMGQTIQTWRTEATDGVWQTDNNWWNFPNGSPIVFGQQEWDNNHFTSQTSNADVSTWRFLFKVGASSVHSFSGNKVRFFDSSGNNPGIYNESGATHIISMPLEGDGDAEDPFEIHLNSTGGITFASTFNNSGSNIDVLGSASGAKNVTFEGVISGTGGMIVDHVNATVVMDATNTFTGQLTINAGVVRLDGVGDSFGASTQAVRIGAGTTLDLNDVSVSVGSVAEQGSSDGGTIDLGTGTLTINGGFGGSLFQNSINGTGSIIKNGTGILSLYGTQSFSGTTTINGGSVATSANLSSSSITVNAGGTFSVAGATVSVNGLTLNLGSTLTIGSGRTLTVNGTLTVANGAIISDEDLVRIVIGASGSIATSDPAAVVSAATFTREITGGAGWRLLSVPKSGFTVANLAAQTAIQGVPGGANSGFNSNLFTSYTTATNAWVSAGNHTDVFGAGQGFVLYFFNNNNAGSSTLPVTLTASGDDLSDVKPTLSGAGLKFNLIGNPYGHAIDVRKLIGRGAAVPSVLQLWDDSGTATTDANGNTGTWKSTSTLDHKLGVWQAAFIENSSDATDVFIPNLAKLNEFGGFFKEVESDERFITLRLDGHHASSGVRTVDRASTVYFHATATDGWDQWDASKIRPLTPSTATIGFMGERKGEPTLQSQYSLPYDQISIIEIPMDFQVSNMGGAFEISVDQFVGLPALWSVLIRDNQTSAVVDLREGAYSFDHHTMAKILPVTVEPRAIAMSATSNPRFTLIIDPHGVTLSTKDDGRGTMDEFAIEQNYPNPFNPSTVIGFQLAVAGEARLTIYDILGRQVAVLVNGTMSAGAHSVNFDASNLTSGVYMYKLEAGGMSQVRRMTLVK